MYESIQAPWLTDREEPLYTKDELNVRNEAQYEVWRVSPEGLAAEAAEIAGEQEAELAAVRYYERNDEHRYEMEWQDAAYGDPYADLRGIGTGSVDVGRFEAACENAYEDVCGASQRVEAFASLLSGMVPGSPLWTLLYDDLLDARAEEAAFVQALSEARARCS